MKTNLPFLDTEERIAKMSSIDEFMHRYFSEWSQLNQVQETNSEPFRAGFFSAPYLQKLHETWAEDVAYQRSHPAVILSIENHGKTAEVVVSQPLGREHEYRRYQLQLTENGWKIERRGWQCFSCKGVVTHNEQNCSTCGGAGWIY